MRRLSLLAALTMLGMLMFATAAVAQSRGPSGADGTYNCEDFDTQQQAQQFFLANNPSLDPNGLDGPEGHASTGIPGVACEDLPGPTDLTPAPGYPGASTPAPVTTTSTTTLATPAPAATTTLAQTASPTPTAATTPAAATPTAGTLPNSGGPVLLLPAAALLVGCGLVALGLTRRNS